MLHLYIKTSSLTLNFGFYDIFYYLMCCLVLFTFLWFTNILKPISWYLVCYVIQKFVTFIKTVVLYVMSGEF